MSGNRPVLRWLGVAVALAAAWPMAHALDAVGSRDYLGAVLLFGLTWIVARTGVELAALADERPE